MWVSLQEEIRDKAELLKSMGYEYTAKWCESISKNLQQYAKLPKMLNKDFDDLFSTFKNEYINLMVSGTPKLREKYLNIVQILLEEAIRNSPNPRQMFAELIPFRDQGVNTSRKTGELAKVFGDLGERFLEVRVYASLLIFMLHLEGNYFPALRELCALKLAGEGKDVHFETIQKMTVDDIKEEFGDFGKPLFRIYDDVGRNLRNAIAHANFRYEKKLICWNLNPYTRKETWRRNFTFDELSAISADLYSISHAYIVWYTIRELSAKIAEYVIRKKPT
jgi:hypothetical protein